MHYPPETSGNAPYAGALASALSARGHDVSAYVAHPHYPEWKLRAGYGQWGRTEVADRVVIRRMRHYIPNPPRGARRLLSELTFGIRLVFNKFGTRSIVIAVSPALISTALVALRIRLTPRRPRLVVWVQDIYTLGMRETKEGAGLAVRTMQWVEGLTLRAADQVIVIHPTFCEFLVENFRVKPERTAVVRNWTHLKPVPPITKNAARIALGWDTDSVLAVHTGNMGAKQGLENVVAAARLADEELLPIRFVLVGDGGERSRLEQLAEGISRIQFVDPLDPADYQYALAAADCLVVNEMPGVANMAVPSKLTSYFHAMRPVVAATDPDGITASEVQRSGAGCVVPAGDPRALLDMAVDLSLDHCHAAKLGAAGYSFCREFLSEDAAIESFERVIEGVMRLDGIRRPDGARGPGCVNGTVQASSSSADGRRAG
ncbi:glycosyltransferase family 4 protein [Mycolicibacterium frederiksbergense]|nr:glycosyltransferase family 4 protein [Mycolicibacterium frederiksbergense]MDO0972833.1 glycosyltransferase family 4 protein [Mycolicibacterium frederiksbergense]